MMENDGGFATDSERTYPSRESHALQIFACGLLTGATLAVLFAPARGRDTRRRIASTTRRGREQVSRLIDGGRRAVERRKGRVVTMTDQARTQSPA